MLETDTKRHEAMKSDLKSYVRSFEKHYNISNSTQVEVQYVEEPEEIMREIY